ncbi:MAG: DUF4189 domain-containing protein [Moraxella sp.]|nr:DUF4189 domain-containing protein [Moraxella sp.]
MKKYVSLFLLLVPVAMYAGTVDSASKFKKNLKGYPVQAVVEQWGEPNIAKEKRGDKMVYGWKSCYETGIIKNQCSYGSCDSWKEVKCCTQSVVVDSNNIIQDFNQGGDANARCYSHLDYGRIHQYQKTYDTMYGKIGLLGASANAKYAESMSGNTNVDKSIVDKIHEENCQGKCIKTIEFKNTCVAIARPNPSDKHISEYVVAKDKDINTAVNKALEQCNKKASKQGKSCIALTWNDEGTLSSKAMCAIP